MNQNAITCPECVQSGQQSRVYTGVAQSTLLYCPGFYDESGRVHNHDSNTIETEMQCSQGHTFLRKEVNKCWCGWPVENSEVKE